MAALGRSEALCRLIIGSCRQVASGPAAGAVVRGRLERTSSSLALLVLPMALLDGDHYLGLGAPEPLEVQLFR